MTDPKEVLLRQMETSLKDAKLDQYIDHVSELLRDHLPCFCFLNKQGTKYWKSQLERCDEIYQDAWDAQIDEVYDSYRFKLINGFLLLMTQEEELAYEHLSEAIEQEYPSDIACLLRAYCESEINPSRMQDATDAVLQWPSALSYRILAGEFYDLKQIDKAIFFYEKSLAFNKYSACTYQSLANCYAEFRYMGNLHPIYKRALEYIDIAILQNPTEWEAYNNKCKYLSKAGQYERAIECAQEGIRLFPDKYGPYFRLAWVQAKTKDYKGAIKNYEKYLEKFPNNKAALKNINLAKKALGISEEDSVKCLLQSYSKKTSVYDKNYFLFYYIPQSADTLSSYVLKFKDNNDKIVKALTTCVADQLKVLISQGLKIDFVVRALGSSETFANKDKPLDSFAQGVATGIGAEYIRLLNKTRPTRKFAKYLTTYNERIAEIVDVYSVSSIKAKELCLDYEDENSFLIVDDVVTSGATLETIGKLLKEMFPSCTLYYLTIARTNRDIGSNNAVSVGLIDSYIKKADADELPI